jgi:hypothetical protein
MKEKSELPPNGFMTVLQRKELNDGLLTEASEELGKAALAAKLSGKKASITLTLTLEPQKGGAISVGATVNAKVPQTKEDSLTIFFVDDDGGLHRDNPRQRELPLQSHDGGIATVEAEEETAQAAS